MGRAEVRRDVGIGDFRLAIDKRVDKRGLAIGKAGGRGGVIQLQTHAGVGFRQRLAGVVAADHYDAGVIGIAERTEGPRRVLEQAVEQRVGISMG